MSTTAVKWQISGDYFENCNCDVACPCLFNGVGTMAVAPTYGACEVPLAFHIDRGSYGDIDLAGLNAVVVMRTPGVMVEGNASVALYVDERADERQRDALGAIFSGAAGGPMGALAPLVTEVLGVKPAAIRWTKDGRRRAVEIPGVMSMAVHAAGSLTPDGEVVVPNLHPLFPDGVALAVGEDGSTWSDYGMRWDNSGKNGHYAAFTWASD